MKKKILLGSIFVLTLLLLMPSIPALQQNVVKNNALCEISEDIEFEDVKELWESGKLDNEKFPILYSLIYLWIRFRSIRAKIIAIFAGDVIDFETGNEYFIHYPILFFRSLMLLINTFIIFSFFNALSNTFGWNWEFDI